MKKQKNKHIEQKGKKYSKKKPKKPVRSISGVTPLTVVLKPRKCDHGTCIYCPGGDHVPQSYTDKSPAVMRALSLQFDPYRQVKNRLKVLNIMGHQTEKIEIIILGGTFLQYDLDYQYEFIKKCYDALNDRDARNLEEAKKWNETAKHRCVAMCIENRPDNCSPKEIQRMLDFGATRVEIGVQMPDDELYKKTNRGHSVKDVVEATKRLKNSGFKLGYHIMPGLPFSNKEKDLKLFKEIWNSEKFRPDQLKIYPCQVIKDSPLEKMYEKIDYKPYDREETAEILKQYMKIIPEYCRVMRVMREIPKEKMEKGILRLDLRKDVEEKLRNKGVKIKEIRMREVGFNKEDLNEDLRLRILEYNASGGKEHFLQIVNEDNVLFGLLRLRLTDGENGNPKRAMIRELHVYGRALEISMDSKKKKAAQHKGLGKWLMEKAEEIAQKEEFDEIYVISGIGVREYYKKIGYELKEPYMVKKF